MVLSEFPVAKQHLEEKGRQILTKMGILDESAEGQQTETEKVEIKLDRLESNLDTLQTKLARLMSELESSNRKMQGRVELLELEVDEMDQLPLVELGGEGRRAWAAVPCCIRDPTPNQKLLKRVKLFSTTSEPGLQGWASYHS